MARTILHVDMDAFFASVEQRDDPTLRGRPVLVGGAGRRGVVAAASYEARAFGCRSAMPTARALALCPDAVVVRPHFERYREASDRVFQLFEECTDLVEPLSIDEAFLDVTGSRRLLGDGLAIANRLRARVRQATGLTASVGVAPNKFLAKLASAMQKPDGLVVVDETFIRERLPTVAVRRMWGVGPATEARLVAAGMRSFGELACADVQRLSGIVGSDAERLIRLARGDDDRPVVSDRSAKSIGQERTFHDDLERPEQIREMLFDAVVAISRRLRRAGLAARGVTIKLRSPDFHTITRSATLDEPTDRTDLVWSAVRSLFESWAIESFGPIRLAGASLDRLGPRAEPGDDPGTLFPDRDDVRRRALDAVADRIHARFGDDAARRRVSG